MNCASHPDAEERTDAPEIPSAVTVVAFRGGRAKPKPRYAPSGPDTPDEWRLNLICERGAYFCPHCIRYQFSEAGACCRHCGQPCKWNPPIFSNAKEIDREKAA